jgi:hypothetical protein
MEILSEIENGGSCNAGANTHHRLPSGGQQAAPGIVHEATGQSALGCAFAAKRVNS